MTITAPDSRTTDSPESPPQVTVNGRPCSLDGILANTTALNWLRDIGLTGAKEGCAEGECGACSVLVARPDYHDAETRTQWTAINACLIPAATLDGQEVVTSEGLGTPTALHPVQQEMAVRGGSQCGYCTPGFVCSMAAEYYRADRGQNPEASYDADETLGYVEHAESEHGPNGFDLHSLSGNLCRCTGYRPIQDAAYALGMPPEDDAFAARLASPPPSVRHTRIAEPDGEFVRPTSLSEATRLLGDHPDAVLVAGSTDWGVEVNIRGIRAPYAIAVDRLPELRGLDVERRLGRARRRPDAHRDRAPPGRSDPVAGPRVPPVRLAADPQRRHDRRQPRHRLTHRRHSAGAAGAGGRARPGVGRRRP